MSYSYCCTFNYLGVSIMLWKRTVIELTVCLDTVLVQHFKKSASGKKKKELNWNEGTFRNAEKKKKPSQVEVRNLMHKLNFRLFHHVTRTWFAHGPSPFALSSEIHPCSLMLLFTHLKTLNHWGICFWFCSSVHWCLTYLLFTTITSCTRQA